jgi:mono/diheme cytochrome c family protein
MPRWFLALSSGLGVAAGLACNDDTTEVVDKTVCYSEMRWVGEKRGSPEMFPGRDCVGCHIDNDGPPLAVGGTIYPYVLGQGAPGLTRQTGTDCFGLEGVNITIEDADGQAFELVTNRAGNFYIEGNPDDFAKPFNAVVYWTDGTGAPKMNPMSTTPSYGGCANCHNPAGTAVSAMDAESPDKVVIPTARIGLPGNGPGEGAFETIEDELNAAGCMFDPEGRGCARLFEKYAITPPASVPAPATP